MPDIRVRGVHAGEDSLTVDLMDGRSISVPLAWYPRLLSATPEQRRRWEIAGAGYGIHWPEIDEDLSTEGLLRGAPAPPGATTSAQLRPRAKRRAGDARRAKPGPRDNQA
ncbi:MAG TPA: DUF2442 domain-containing protein [Stellaceae bacterium]|nr:DUF2442 domain-containing protein [Stellaceae bacterium]